MKTTLQLIKKQYVRIICNLVIVIVFLGSVMQLYQLPIMSQLENIAYDTRVKLSMPNTVDDRIVIIDIDEKSLSEIGRWPWGRDVMARLTNLLFDDYGVYIIGYDIVFAEEDKSSGLYILNKLAKDELSNESAFVERVNELQETLDYDQLFLESIENRRVVLGYYFNNKDLISGALPKPVFTEEDFSSFNINARQAKGYGSNLARFQLESTAAGHFNPWIDDDGIIRRVPMLYQFEGDYYESLSLSIVRQLIGVDKIAPIFGEASGDRVEYYQLEYLQIGDLKIPVDDFIQALVPYRGKKESFRYISVVDVLNGKIKKADLENRIVLVGTSAPGLFDLRATPVENKYPGVEVHANLIAGMLDGSIKLRPSFTIGAEFLQILIFGTLLSFIVPCISPLIANLVFAIFLTLIIGLNFIVWEAGNLVLPIAPMLLLILCLYLFNMTFGFFIERRGKKEISGLFGQYIPSEVVDELSENPQAASMEAENREMTVLFSDVRGFTTISEGLEPAELSELMNAILTPLTAIIHQNKGTIDKYMGDAVMAFWGAPLKDEDHARHALQAGYEMIERMQALRHEFKERGWPEINIGIGINTGEMSVGNMGSEFRMAYTVLGDTVNLGSRLEGLTKTYGVDIIVSKDTKVAVSEYAFLKLDRVRVKGKNEPVSIYQPIAKLNEISAEEENEIDEYEKALNFYYRQEWDKARSKLLMLKETYTNRKVYDIYIERIGLYMNEPPPDSWDGVFTHTTK